MNKCNKTTYYSKDGADKVLLRIHAIAKKDKAGKRFKPTRSYKCSVCGFYHLTSQVLGQYKK